MLTLREPDLATIDAAIESPGALAAALGGCEVAEGWEVFPAAIPHVRESLATGSGSARWGPRLFILDEPPTLIGWGGFKGQPVDGTVELGYSIAPAHRNRGAAGAAVAEMLREAYEDEAVTSVIAHTLPEEGPSTRVLVRSGFVLDDEDAEEGGERVWRWRHRPA